MVVSESLTPYGICALKVAELGSCWGDQGNWRHENEGSGSAAQLVHSSTEFTVALLCCTHFCYCSHMVSGFVSRFLMKSWQELTFHASAGHVQLNHSLGLFKHLLNKVVSTVQGIPAWNRDSMTWQHSCWQEGVKVDIGLLIPKSGSPLLIGKLQAKGFVKENCHFSICYEK